MERFRMAPMTRDLRIMTIALFFLPLIFLLSALPDSIVRPVMLGVGLLMVLLYAYVWFRMRPSRFDVGTGGIRIIWPTRARDIPARSIRSVGLFGRKEFLATYGKGVRVGAGGLWGGFGHYRANGKIISMYISRTDRFVVLELEGDRPLMITPEDAERFVASVERLRNAGPI